MCARACMHVRVCVRVCVYVHVSIYNHNRLSLRVIEGSTSALCEVWRSFAAVFMESFVFASP